MQTLAPLNLPKNKGTALDFGCGAGRLTRALSYYFDRSTGVDVSETMIAKARELNQDRTQCTFQVNDTDDLAVFSSNYFDLIFTILVLQHVPSVSLIKGYIKEFARCLKPGGILVFQLPAYIPFYKRIQPRRRLFNFLKALGFSKQFIYQTLKLHPMSMKAIGKNQVLSLLKSLQLTVVKTQEENHGDLKSVTYFATKPAS